MVQGRGCRDSAGVPEMQINLQQFYTVIAVLTFEIISINSKFYSINIIVGLSISFRTFSY